jgi:hypothetical protein
LDYLLQDHAGLNLFEMPSTNFLEVVEVTSIAAFHQKIYIVGSLSAISQLYNMIATDISHYGHFIFELLHFPFS